MTGNDIKTNTDGMSTAGKLWKRITGGKYSFLIPCFFLPFLLLLFIYACYSVHPFGNSSVLSLDMQAQFIYYFEEYRNALTSGESLLYSWHRTLGGEFLGIYSYYLASPFNIFILLFPKANIADAVLFVQLMKVGTMGLTFGLFLKKTRESTKGNTAIVIFSTMYALCAYSVVNLMNVMWLDGVVFLPLIVLGLRELVDRKRFLMYTISLAVTILSNYYIGYMMCIFSFIYFIYYYFLRRPELRKLYDKGGEGKKDRTFGEKVKYSAGAHCFGRFVLFSLLAAGIAAVLILPGYYSLSFGKQSFATTNLSPYARFDIMDFIMKLLPGSYDNVRPLTSTDKGANVIVAGLPMVYSGVLALILLPLYFITGKPAREKLFAAGLIGVIFISFFINTIDIIWHGLSTPQWLNYRYSFVFSFIVIGFAYDAFLEIQTLQFKHIAISSAVITAITVFIQKVGYSFFRGDDDYVALDDMECIVLTIVLVMSYTVLLYLINKKMSVRLCITMLAVIAATEAFAAGMICIEGVRNDVGVTAYAQSAEDAEKNKTNTSYTGNVSRVYPIISSVLKSDTSFYRMESELYRKVGGVNEQMAYGMNGISHSTSTLNRSVIYLMGRLGYASPISQHWTKYLGDNPVSDALLGIKYVVSIKDKDTNLYSVYTRDLDSFSKNSSYIYVYQNKNALSPVYGVSPSIMKLNDEYTYDGDFSVSAVEQIKIALGLMEETKNELEHSYFSAIELLNRLVGEMVSPTYDDLSIFNPIGGTSGVGKVTLSGINCTSSLGSVTVADHAYTKYTVTDGTQDAYVKFTVTTAEDGPVYFYFPNADIRYQATIYLNGISATNKLCDYFTNDTGCIYCAGSYEAGETFTLYMKINNSNGIVYFNKLGNGVDSYFFTLDYDAFEAAMDTLSRGEMSIDEYGSNYLSGTINVREGYGLILTTIPYDEGWKVYLDGEKVEYTKALNSLIAIDVSDYDLGVHDLSFRYVPSCYTKGLAITIVSLIVLTAVGYLYILRARIDEKKKISPFGVWAAKTFFRVRVVNKPAAAAAAAEPASEAQTREETAPAETVPAEADKKDAPAEDAENENK